MATKATETDPSAEYWTPARLRTMASNALWAVVKCPRNVRTTHMSLSRCRTNLWQSLLLQPRPCWSSQPIIRTLFAKREIGPKFNLAALAPAISSESGVIHADGGITSPLPEASEPSHEAETAYISSKHWPPQHLQAEGGALLVRLPDFTAASSGNLCSYCDSAPASFVAMNLSTFNPHHLEQWPAQPPSSGAVTSPTPIIWSSDQPTCFVTDQSDRPSVHFNSSRCPS